MDRRTFLGALATGVGASLAGCGGSGGGDRPQGTLITGGGDGGDGGDGGGDGGDGFGTPTEPPTTGAQDVFTGVDFDIRADDGGTLTTWTIENTSEFRWSVTVVSVLTIEPTATGGTTTTSTVSERLTLPPGARTTVKLRHDVSFDAWSDFRFEFRNLERA
jgi:hypothetical protein